MSYQYKGKGFVQITGNNMNNTPIPSISISTISHPLTQSAGQQIAYGNVVLGQNAKSQNGLGNVGLFENLYASAKHYKKYEVYEFVEDILAISCAWKRQRVTEPGQFKYQKITDKGLCESVNNDDRELARQIRDYYSKKLMVINLRGDNLTPFRKALNTYIHGDSCKTTDDVFPVIYKLPEFYDYDNKIDEIKISMEDRIRGDRLSKYHGKSDTFEITPVSRLQKNNRITKLTEYWFKEKNNMPVMIHLDPKNPLLHIWDDIFNSKKVLQISGKSFVKKLDDFEYLSISDWKLVIG